MQMTTDPFWAQALATQPVAFGRSIGYKEGFAAGLEAAAKACEDSEFADADTYRFVRTIRALSPPPSATVHPQPKALPRPGE